MIPPESDGIRWNSGIPVNSCRFRRNFRIPADSGGIRGGIKSIDDRILVCENGLWNLKGHFTVALEDNEDLEWSCENGQYSAHVMIVTLFTLLKHFII